MLKPFYKNRSGFTLVEVVVSLTIIAILILLALPTYQDTLLKSRRAEARSALHLVMLQQERFYTQHNTYSAFTSKTTSPFKWWSGSSVENSYYEINGEPCPGRPINQCVLLTAESGTSNVKHVDDAICGNLMLDSANNKTYSNGSEPNSLCW
ncbi:MAG: pilus assembly protein PilE [Solimicrobium sp.]|jgi:type IV pilus assembly protein PilE|nr:pilus assembly protein PilE [Solimicrobium sp.]